MWCLDRVPEKSAQETQGCNKSQEKRLGPPGGKRATVVHCAADATMVSRQGSKHRKRPQSRTGREGAKRQLPCAPQKYSCKLTTLSKRRRRQNSQSRIRGPRSRAEAQALSSGTGSEPAGEQTLGWKNARQRKVQ